MSEGPASPLKTPRKPEESGFVGPEASTVSLRERKPRSHLDVKTQEEASAGAGSGSFRVNPCLRATLFPFVSEEEDRALPVPCGVGARAHVLDLP